MKRHLFLLSIFFLISCGRQEPAEEPVVYVYNWSDYIAQERAKDSSVACAGRARIRNVLSIATKVWHLQFP